MFYAVNNKKQHRVIPYEEMHKPHEVLVRADNKGWVEWLGGNDPLPYGSPCEYKMRDVEGSKLENAYNLRWDHDGSATDIIAYHPLVTDPELKEGDLCQYYCPEDDEEWAQAVYVTRYKGMFIVVDGETAVLVEPWHLERLSEKQKAVNEMSVVVGGGVSAATQNALGALYDEGYRKP